MLLFLPPTPGDVPWRLWPAPLKAGAGAGGEPGGHERGAVERDRWGKDDEAF